MHKELAQLFRGNEDAYGTSIVAEAEEVGDKVNAEYATLREPVTPDLWEAHVKGEKGLGIIPINTSNQCYWGCIDIDQYDSFNYKELLSKLEKHSLPLVVCKSKSGGAHVFLFVSEPIAAKKMQEILKKTAAQIGQSKAEIFPKQISLKPDSGNCGNWLNMPYFNGDETDRYGLDTDAKRLTLKEFLAFTNIRRINIETLAGMLKYDGEDEYKEFPPCIIALMNNGGWSEGNRNTGMFHVMVAFRKRGDNWKKESEEFNQKYFHPPLPAKEIIALQGQHEKNKSYRFLCDQQPQCDHCDSRVCAKRKYGIDEQDIIPDFNSLQVQDTEDPLWFLSTGEGTVELQTIELNEFKRFQTRCMETFKSRPQDINQKSWGKILDKLMKKVIVVAMPDDVGAAGQFKELLETFISNRMTDDKSQIKRGRCYINGDDAYFRLGALQQYVERNGLRSYGRNKIARRLEKLGAKAERIDLNGHRISVYCLRDFERQTEKFPVKPAKGDVI